MFIDMERHSRTRAPEERDDLPDISLLWSSEISTERTNYKHFVPPGLAAIATC
jgi:hypothetical protein